MKTAHEMDVELVVGMLAIVLSAVGFLTGAYAVVFLGALVGAVGFGMLLMRRRE
jgi:hypothetical protein